MWSLLIIAARNVSRNRRRSIISGAAVFVGVLGIVLLQGLLNSFLTRIVDDTVLAKVGAIQVHKRGWQDADHDLLDYDLPDDQAFRQKLAAIPGVTGVTPRITFDGMLSNGAVSSMVGVAAIDPATEYTVCPKRRESIAPGSDPLVPGASGGGAGDVSAALVGSELAESLGAKKGAVLSLLSASKGGAANALDLTVVGFLPSRDLLESKRLSVVTLALAQDLLRMKGRVTEYALSVSDVDQADEIAARVQAATGDGYQAQAWKELAPSVRDRLVRTRIILWIITGILFFLVGTGIANTMLMSVYERVREIGTMLAVGTRRRQVMSLFLAEAATLGLAGGLLGASVGAAIVASLGAHGFTMSPPGGDPAVFHPFITGRFVAGAIAFAALGTVVAGLYPAWKASKLRPADALRAT